MDIKVPEVGESVREATIAAWHKKDGETVRRDEVLCELETDKITLELNAEADGVLHIQVAEGETVEIGSTIGTLEEAEVPAGEKPAPPEEKKETPSEAAPEKAPPPKSAAREESAPQPPAEKVEPKEEPSASPTEKVRGLAPAASSRPEEEGRSTRKPMSSLRRKIAERLVSARQQTAMLTTFNEADLGRIQQLREKHKESFQRKHGVSLGLMSFFVKACVKALQEFPEVNARIDGNDLVYHHFYDLGIAVGSERGLVVPVLRDADRLHFAEIEQGIRDLVEKVTSNQLNLSDLEGGTFTITNGGVYGSMLSTPILNPPQSAVLGMHAIKERPVVRDGQIVIRPIMYLALSYDHRIIDGREAVSFLKRIVEYVEEPEEMLLEM